MEIVSNWRVSESSLFSNKQKHLESPHTWAGIVGQGSTKSIHFASLHAESSCTKPTFTSTFALCWLHLGGPFISSIAANLCFQFIEHLSIRHYLTASAEGFAFT